MKNDNTLGLRGSDRGLQRDAIAWKRFTGMKHTQAVRLMQHPLAQGILGERVSARALVRVLSDSPVLRDSGSETPATNLGENGLWSADESPLGFTRTEDFIQLVLAVEVLRMFEPISEPSAFSYSLKHVAENFLGEVLNDFSYLSNGKLIWAAAVEGLPLKESDPVARGLNAHVGVNPEQVAYIRSLGTPGPKPKAHHHRPPGYLYLRAALVSYAETGETPARWDGIDREVEPLSSPFHDWLIAQVGPEGNRGEMGSRERLAFDYSAGIFDNDHRIARTPEDLLSILREVGAAAEFHESARRAVMEWVKTDPQSAGLRTERIHAGADDHGGYGAGSGTVERYEYMCPCGDGTILEEHDNIPGFREHDVRIMCGKCRAEWQFKPSASVRDWRLEPLAVPTIR